MRNKNIYKIILTILIITAIYFVSLLLFKYMNNIENEKQMQLISNQILEQSINDDIDHDNNKNTVQKNQQIEEKSNMDIQTKNNTAIRKQNNLLTEINGYKIIGAIEIPKINLKYPILEVNNEQTMKISITKFWGNGVNESGNLTLAGHNNLDGTMFGKIKKLKIQDEIKLTNINKISQIYKVYNIYITTPDDTSIVNENDNQKEVTLITCSNGRKNRLIIKARSQ